MIHPETVATVIARSAERHPQAPAIGGPARADLTYGELTAELASIHEFLRSHEIGPRDVVVLVLPGGPEAAALSLAIASHAVLAPINPALREDELRWLFDRLQPSAVFASAETAPRVFDLATDVGALSVRVSPRSGAHAGRVALDCLTTRRSGPPRQAVTDDIAVILHTTGTTARPRLVPLTHRNVCAVAASVAGALELGPRDRALNVSPLYHVHGLTVVTLSSISAGASVWYAPGFVATSFFGWLDEARPTWFSAVPSIHQTILERAGDHRAVIARAGLRFVRSGASSMSPELAERVEQVFSAPFLEGYGLTETSGAATSMPLPPRPRARGSVGLPIGCELAIVDSSGQHCGPGVIGEIAVRGDAVMRGYLEDEPSSPPAVASGWFRTGDLGTIDGDGFLFYKGRVKELINRAGMKVSPYEVDEVLCMHPDVAEAGTFGVPDDKLGEDVAAAVVLRPGATLTVRELKLYAAQRLADYKVPRRIAVVDVLPKNAGGKLLRARLHELLTPEDLVEPTASVDGARPALEAVLTALWREVLGRSDIEPDDDFFTELGGDSVLATRMLGLLRERLGNEVSIVTFYDESTIARLARVLG